jgi:hypothetical protein
MHCFYFCGSKHKDKKNLNLICDFVSKLNVMQMQYIPCAHINNERITFPNVNLCNILSISRDCIPFSESTFSLIFDI